MRICSAVLLGGSGYVKDTGRRFGEVAGLGDLPKELFQVHGEHGEMPIAFYAIDRHLKMGAETVFVVVSNEKYGRVRNALDPYFGADRRITYATQMESRGTADAVACLAGDLRKGDDLTVSFGDEKFNEEDALVGFYRNGADGAICVGTLGVSADKAHRYGIVESGPDGNIVDIREKPHCYGRPGRAIHVYRFPQASRILDWLENVEPQAEDHGGDEKMLSIATRNMIIDGNDAIEVPMDLGHGSTCSVVSIKDPLEYLEYMEKVRASTP